MLNSTTFILCAEQIEIFLRIPEQQRLGNLMLQEKFADFCDRFPEVDDRMFIYAVNQWMQSIKPTAFTRFPGWTELMAFLYRCDGTGLPVRHAGFKPTLPPRAQPTPQQLAMLPPRPDCNAPEGAECPEMYRVFSAPRPNGLLPEGYR